MSRRAVAIAIVLIVTFVAGIGVGEALDDGSSPGGTQSLVRTLRPLALTPAARQTVTVTVSSR